MTVGRPPGPHASSSESLKIAWRSDTGLARSHNEDVVLAIPESGVFAVIDGVGGEVAGERGASEAAQVLRSSLAQSSGRHPADQVREAITLANNRLVELVEHDPSLDGMSCVLTVALLEDQRLTVGHVGDTRLYLCEPGRLRKVTRDHSPVGLMEEMREISEEDARRHPRRNEIFRDVGGGWHRPEDDEFVDVYEVSFGSDQAILLCTDGLTDQVSTEHILQIVERCAGHPRETVEQLVQEANHAGGKDNVSVLVVEGEGFADRIFAPHLETGAQSDTQRLLALSPDAPTEKGREAAVEQRSAAAEASSASATDSLPATVAPSAKPTAQSSATSAAGAPARTAAASKERDSGRGSAPARRAGFSEEARSGSGSSGSGSSDSGTRDQRRRASVPAGGCAHGTATPRARTGAGHAARRRSLVLPLALLFLVVGVLWVGAGLPGAPARMQRAVTTRLPDALLFLSGDSPRVLGVGPRQQFLTIADALQKARPGDVVELEPGLYEERVRLRSGVTLRGRLPGTAILRSEPEGTHDEVVLVQGNQVRDVVLAGLVVEGRSAGDLEVGIRLVDSSVLLDDVVVRGTREAGLELLGNDRSTVRYSDFAGNLAAAIVIEGEAASRIVDSLLRDNGRAGDERPAQAALRIGVDAAPLVAGNSFQGNGVAVSLAREEMADRIRLHNSWGDGQKIVVERSNPPSGDS